MNSVPNKYLIKEEVDQSKVIDAIKRRKEVRASYISDDDPKGSGERIIEPVAFGLSKSGNPVIRAFQPFGDTKTKVPHWKLFRLDKFNTWKTLNNRTFKEPPGIQYNSDGKFNPSGDKSMSEIFVIADFKGANKRYETGGLKKRNDQIHADKISKNPFYDLEKQTGKNKIMVGPDAMKEVNRWKPNADMQKYLNGASAEEMSKTSKFGDDTFTQTVEPVIKGETKQENPVVKSPNTKQSYKNVAMNGPIIKGMEQEKKENENNNINKEENSNSI